MIAATSRTSLSAMTVRSTIVAAETKGVSLEEMQRRMAIS